MSAAPEQFRIAGDIPALLWQGAGSGLHPVIISLHGAGGSKHDIAPETIESVTARGITLLTIDAYLHGDRAPAGFNLQAPGAFRSMLFLEIIAHTAQDLFTVVAFLRDRAAIDGDHIGLRGGSMGGYIALSAVSIGLTVEAVLSLAGGGDYLQWFPRRIKVDGPDAPDAGELHEHEDLVRRIDPLHHLTSFPPRPVFLIHGERDPLSPIGGDQALYRALVPRYQEQPQNCLFLRHAGEHATPPLIEDVGWQWLMRCIGGKCVGDWLR